METAACAAETGDSGNPFSLRACRTYRVSLTEDRRARIEETRPGPAVPGTGTPAGNEEPDFS